MSASQPPVESVIDAIPGRTLPSNVNMVFMGMMGIGVAGAAYGFASAGAAWTWGAILVAIVYTLAMGQGGVMFAVVMSGTEARWGRPMKRVAESFAFYLPFGFVALLLFLLLGIGIYPWHEGTILETGPVDLKPHSPAAVAAKEIWLDKWTFIIRMLIAVGGLIAMDFLYLRASLAPDLLKAKQRLGDKSPSWWNYFIGNNTDVDALVEQGQKTQNWWVPFLGFGYALVFSLIAFDLIMSLSPLWYTNMFGAWIFGSSFWLGLCTLGVVGLMGRDWLGMREWAKNNVFHDLGKLILAFCMFWAYTLFAQLLPIWYTNVPEEMDFILVRLFMPEWQTMSYMVAVLCFLMPFTTLLSRGIKKMRWPFVVLLCIIMTGLFMERSLLVMPSIFFGDEFPLAWFLGVNVPIWIGFLGLFGSVVGRVLATIPVIPITDPFLPPHPWDVHVHSLDDGHAHH
jgi:hypothetical protein